MAPQAPPASVVVLSAEHRIRTALRALLEAGSGYALTVAATAAEARALLAAGEAAAVVVGLGSSSPATDRALIRVAQEAHRRPAVVVGSRDGHDLDADPDTILAAVEQAVSAALADRP